MWNVIMFLNYSHFVQTKVHHQYYSFQYGRMFTFIYLKNVSYKLIIHLVCNQPKKIIVQDFN